LFGELDFYSTLYFVHLQQHELTQVLLYITQGILKFKLFKKWLLVQQKRKKID